MRRVRWGVLSTANIGRKKVIPAMQQCASAEIAGICSRSLENARAVAAELKIPKAYGSYEELLCDPEIEAIYNPLPNHLHAEWTIRAAEKGKHVLCEKPIGLNAAEARKILAARDEYGVKIGEAFMVRNHPQWLRTMELVRSGRIGKLRSATGYFSYFNNDPKNVRNELEYGGGALLDIGCYPVKTTRMVFGEEPVRVSASIERDPKFKTDRLVSGILEYPSGQCVFTVSTQLVPFQKMQFFGTEARIDVEVPFNAPPDKPTRIFIDDGKQLYAGESQTMESFAVCDQYTIQGDLFSKAVIENTEVPNPVEDAICNMAVLDALFRAGKSGRWEVPEKI
jgi:predicted dehydrogenase